MDTLVQLCKECSLLELSCDSVVVADLTLGANFKSCEKCDYRYTLRVAMKEGVFYTRKATDC